MRILDIITKKRNGAILTNGEISAIISDYSQGTLPDYQMAAFLMAVYFQGMNYEETAAMTMAMAHSGSMIELTDIPGIKVDKHSTGGVADTTTLILAPLVAAAGVPVAKMSGRGLGFTGGTIDKLDAIPGFRTALTMNEFCTNLNKHKIAITAQTDDIAPADGKIYALRDVTATVESIPLIASSIMSKKIASGADKILLDVKVGNGAFMKTLDEAKHLAKTMVKIGEIMNRSTVAVITSMEEPLGLAVGNSLEVLEAIDVLQGKGPQALHDVCLVLGAHMLKMANLADEITQGQLQLQKLLKSGKALQKFEELITAQNGNPAILSNPQLLPQAEFKAPVYCSKTGYITAIDTQTIGSIATMLGAGRAFKGQAIDLAAGLVLQKRINDYVESGDAIAVLYTNNKNQLRQAQDSLLNAIHISDIKAAQPQLVLGVVDSNGFTEYRN